MNKRLRRAHRIYVIFVIVFFFLLFYPLYYIAASKPVYYRWLNKLRKYNARCCCLFTGIFFRLTYEQPLNNERTYIYCANHSSNLDIMAFCLLATGKFHFMGKEELLKNPVLKLFFNTIDIPVSRSNRISAFRAFKKAGHNLESGRSLIIFPEGGISAENYPPVLSPFKNGPFRLAIEKKILVVPVTLCDIWKKMWDDGEKYGSSPGICDIYIHKAIPTAHLTLDDTDRLKDEVFELINSKLVTQ
ncbi:1-acyl-sn-glycerol-3-phosphate acyltransferase [Pedobacter sp. CAN_A7]|uniref:lysophospholipid acyltransferase family protein n=1 Tax=Pedobacter sp. CAN_A7 TaxID=2787722 RepID=UPI0018CA3210